MSEACENLAPPALPLMTHFLQPYPASPCQEQAEAEGIYSEKHLLNMTSEGVPLFLGGRSSSPPTSTMTPGHTIKAGYTSTGKWKPSKWMPSKMDKRAGK
ncbi:hypothetical protein BH09SUM1_BH09SUM1_20140 [soil metagenome]